MTVTTSSTGAAAQWTLCQKLPSYVSSVIPTPTPETTVLFLNAPQFEFVTEVLKMGVKVHIVEQDKSIGQQFIDYVKTGPHALIACKDTPDTYYSADKRLTLHNLPFRSLYAGDARFDSVFDCGFLPILPNITEARRAFGEKLISLCNEDAKMCFFIAEQMGSVKNGEIKELSIIDINFAYGRNFMSIKELSSENPLGYTEVLYLANKTAVGGQFYDEKYSKGYSPWHMEKVNYNLLKHYSRIQPEGQPLRKVIIIAGDFLVSQFLPTEKYPIIQFCLLCAPVMS